MDPLIQIYDDGIQHLKIGESTLDFKPDDGAVIMDLRCEGDIVSFKHQKEHSIFEQMYLPKMHNNH